MKTSIIHAAFLALLRSFLTPPAGACTSPSPVDSLYFCQPVDPDQRERDRARGPSAKFSSGPELNFGRFSVDGNHIPSFYLGGQGAFSEFQRNV